MKIAIIPGHGGFDPGACNKNTGAIEAKGNLAVALKLDEILRYNGFETVLSRKENIACGGATCVKDDITNQINFANNSGADIVVSIHFNSATNKTAHGVEVLYTNYPDLNQKEIQLANMVLNELVKATGMTSRGIKETPQGVGLIKWVLKPCILSENGFISNDQEGSWCTDDAKQWIIAEAHARAICRLWNMAYKSPREEGGVQVVDIDQALKVLAQNYVISSPDYWKQAAGCVKYLDSLLINMAQKLQEVK